MSGARIRIHDDGCGRLHVRWWADDSVFWHEILDSFKARFPTHHDRSFSPRSKTWSVPRSQYGRLAQWVDYWFDADAQQWDDDEDGYAYGRTYSDRSYGQYSRPQRSTSTVEAAYAHLCLTPDASPELVRVVHHWWVRSLHPDTGHGDTTKMASINAAVDTIREDRERVAS